MHYLRSGRTKPSYVLYSEETKINLRPQHVSLSMINENGRRLVIDVNDLRKYNAHRAKQLLINYIVEEVALKRALKDFVKCIDLDYSNKYDEFFVQSILVKSVHYCPATKKTSEHIHTDFTSPSFSFISATSGCGYPTRDDDGNLLQTEYGLSVYKDRQTVTIQESYEKAPVGHASRLVEVLLENDLVDECKPGDKIMVVGSYRCFLPAKGSIFFKTMTIANNVIIRNAKFLVERSDFNICRKLVEGQKDAIFELLANSIAPTLHGHIHVKKAIVCLLLGGVETTLPNKTRIRGDINILLIGDPAVAKSQLLRCVLHVAPFGVCTTQFLQQ
ncbi:DNA replication licensing factor Mcm3-like [Metopolophium dirhodum]|uniref:DNA replication licensing factor Mcm3-like n=1 Tax=Metopolophium dirhodum TaxID=44670 RepID=UPI0029903548|nr:DNA replication licensing factor Mcm3-like [Metopolophium dirhodum]